MLSYGALKLAKLEKEKRVNLVQVEKVELSLILQVLTLKSSPFRFLLRLNRHLQQRNPDLHLWNEKLIIESLIILILNPNLSISEVVMRAKVMSILSLLAYDLVIKEGMMKNLLKEIVNVIEE
jgi:hypothetical protein